MSDGTAVPQIPVDRRAAMVEWASDGGVVRIFRWTRRCEVLGPGKRAVVWVQGCPFQCPGCVVPETLPFAGGMRRNVADVVDFLAGTDGIEGVTFSGGEPFAQASALANVLDGLADRRPELTAMSYTGYTLEWLRAHGTPAQGRLLTRLDLLVDGPYVQRRHTDLRWRGSDNQRVHFLTERCRGIEEYLDDRGTWLEIDVDEDGSLAWSGIPPVGFRAQFEHGLAERGIELHVTR